MGWPRNAESSRESLDREVARLAARQYGVVARAQAARLGATKDIIRQRVIAGRWVQISRHVLLLAGSPPSWRQSLMAACLGWGDGAAVSHTAAAGLWQLSGFKPGPVDLTVPLTRRRKAAGAIHRNVLPPVDVTAIDSIPVTTAARTLIDVAGVASIGVIEEALDDALRRELVSMPRLRWRVNASARSGRPGVAVVRTLLDARERGSVAQSVFETRLLRVLRRARLPQPVLQHQIRRSGRLIGVVDFAFPDVRLAVEADGYRWHSGRTRWERDRARSNQLTLLGWRVIHVTWTDLTRRSEAVVESVRDALAAPSFRPPDGQG